MTTKILAATDKNGNLIRYLLLPGNAAESPRLESMTDGIATKGSVVIADKAYDPDRIRKSLACERDYNGYPFTFQSPASLSVGY